MTYQESKTRRLSLQYILHGSSIQRQQNKLPIPQSRCILSNQVTLKQSKESSNSSLTPKSV